MRIGYACLAIAVPGSEMKSCTLKNADTERLSGNGVNAAQHVWGYFKGKASEAEKRRFQTLLQKFSAGETGI